MSIERVPIGAEALDKMTEGGFPRGSLIILAGGPGSGKSVFGANFILEGSRHGETGVFASLTETRDSFIANTSKLLGHHCTEFTETGKCEFLEISATREGGAPVILQSVLQRVEELGAARLVIDSFSRVSDLLRDKMETRITLQSVFRKLRSLRCTTVLAADIPSGHSYGSAGIEEFVADGLLLLSRELIEERLLRKLEIVKLRGTRLAERESIFTLEGGFRVFKPFEMKIPEKWSVYRPKPDPPGRFTTGLDELDRILGGGYPKGCTVLLEVESGISTDHILLLLTSTVANFGSRGSGMFTIPSTGIDYKRIVAIATLFGVDEKELYRLFRFCVVRPSEKPEAPLVFAVDGADADADIKKMHFIQDELAKETGRPLISLIGCDSLITHYGVEATTRIADTQASRTREKQGLCVLFLKPGYGEIAERLRTISDVNFKLAEKCGSVLFYGSKPRINLHVLEADMSKGYPMPMLTPVI